MIEFFEADEIEKMRPAGRFVADTLTELRDDIVDVGTDLLEIDAFVRDRIKSHGATSCYVDYHPSFGSKPFGHYICTSVNDAVLHGLPHRYRLRDGDLVSLDLAVNVNGWVADSAISFNVGQPRTDDQRMIETCRAALDAAIDVALPGNRIGDISSTIGNILTQAGYGVNTDFGGHGVGRTMHGDPHIPNNGRAGKGMTLKPGLAIAIEPWVLNTTDRYRFDSDGWTLRSADGSRGAHMEHTIVVTDNEPIVLTERA
ncbi:type I methionyl aminopeptidase [Haloglycomyces albus]|uniref:type I methionyl aminopeptidase n=1 Tax=Haloglycomyces albus TaxID=526067 RepID=UPI00046D045C|nr:type I methionyl aminopeptidase [Haloglycomyces albus]